MLETIENILLGALAVAPLVLLPFNYKVWKVYLADVSRPRNTILWVMASNGAIVIFAAFGIAAFALEAIFEPIILPDWWELVFIPLVLLLYTIPIRHARTVDRLATTIDESVVNGPETQDQREDREFGEQRRELEEYHVDEQEKLDNP